MAEDSSHDFNCGYHPNAGDLKEKKEITENDVFSAGRKACLKDVKVVGFSPTHTALKFVLPLDRR